MAMADYYHCDACGGKAFYDADIDDRFERVAMTVLCERCTKRYVIEIRERAAPPRGESEDTARLDTEWLIDQREHARAKRAEYRSDEPPQGDPAQQMAYWRGYDDALGQVMARRVNLRDAARAPAPSAPQEPRGEPSEEVGLPELWIQPRPIADYEEAPVGPVSDDQMEALTGYLLHGWDEDGNTDCVSEEDVKRVRTALDIAGLTVTPVRFRLSRASVESDIAKCAECSQQGRPCHQHWKALSVHLAAALSPEARDAD